MCGLWNAHGDYGWMSDTLGGKFNFYYLVDAMVTDGILDAGKAKIPDDIMTKLQTWYVKYIHDKVTALGINTLTIRGWIDVMEKMDMQSICKNG